MMTRKDFEQLVGEAVEAISAGAKAAMDNVDFVVEPEVRRKKAGEVKISRNEDLLGLYEGVPKIKRGAGYFGVLPDKITIFQRPIEILAGGDPARIKKLIYDVVWHEVGHHLGFDERGIRAREAKLKKEGKRR